MFDQQSPSSSQPPRPAVAEDMFAPAESSAPRPSAPQSFTPPPSALPPVPPPAAAPEQIPLHEGGHVAKFIFVAVVVLLLVGAAGFAAYKFMMQAPANSDGPVRSVSDDGIIADKDDGKGEDDTKEDDDALTDPDASQNKTTFTDSDGDGLSNAEELEAGTLANKADSDDDGLGDREEVEVYGTDAREEDTDDDGFLDGQEVKNGYNPNGDGMLFEIPQN